MALGELFSEEADRLAEDFDEEQISGIKQVDYSSLDIFQAKMNKLYLD